MATDPPFTVDQYLLENPRADFDAISAVIPHRGEMRQLDAVAWWSEDRKQAIGIKDVKPDEFWVEGHIPGNPLLPGVLIIETAAQLCSFIAMQVRDKSQFMGFTRCNECSFRGAVVPGNRLILYAELLSENTRRFISRVTGFVDDKLVFEATITGMVL